MYICLSCNKTFDDPAHGIVEEYYVPFENHWEKRYGQVCPCCESSSIREAFVCQKCGQALPVQNTGNKLPFFLAAATKEKVTDIDIVQIPQSYLDVMLEHFEDYVTGYDAIKMGLIEPERCEKCDYCKATKILTEPRMIGAIDYE